MNQLLSGEIHMCSLERNSQKFFLQISSLARILRQLQGKYCAEQWPIKRISLNYRTVQALGSSRTSNTYAFITDVSVGILVEIFAIQLSFHFL
jgi:hypothetical protein